MTIGEIREIFSIFREKRPPQAVKSGIFSLFSGLAVVATPFDSGIIYISRQIEFLLLFSIWKLDTFTSTENKANAHVCDWLRPAASFCYMVYSV